MTERLKQEIRRLIPDAGLADMVLGTIEQEEILLHENRLKLQQQGIRSAREKGVVLGRPRIEIDWENHPAVRDYLDGRITRKQAATELGISIKTFYNRMKEQERKRAGKR